MLAIALHGCDNGPTDVEEMVQGVTIRGIDISHHNIDAYAPVDWQQVRESDYTFAFVKATDGYKSCWTDPTFTSNMDAGYQAGILMGAYHYARPDANPDATVEAQCFLRAAGKYLIRGYLRPVLDVERGAELGKEALSNWVHLWMNTIQRQTGVEPILYTYSSFTHNFNISVTRYALWLAHYTHDPGTIPNTGLWEAWDFWQYTDRGSVAGVGDPTIDVDLFNGDLARLEREFVIH
jgi:GH25 family lysozyme M1 (1,4-beta-N-acetylmuramidase)